MWERTEKKKEKNYFFLIVLSRCSFYDSLLRDPLEFALVWHKLWKQETDLGRTFWDAYLSSGFRWDSVSKVLCIKCTSSVHLLNYPAFYHRARFAFPRQLVEHSGFDTRPTNAGVFN